MKENFTAENETVMRQQMLLLSLIAYVGVQFTGDRIDVDLKERIEETMARSATVKDRWNIVWGPAIYKYQSVNGAGQVSKCDFPPPQKLKDIPSEDVATHTMFAARSLLNPSLYTIVIRGTNSESCVNLWEDTWGFAELVNWPYGSAKASLKPQFAAGFDFALDKLRAMAPGDAVSGAGQTIVEFLDAIANHAEPGTEPQIIVAGHSLAGGLAPTVALWLANTQGSAWDHDQKARIFSYAYAGTTAGNSDFATWSDQSIGSRTYRVWQTLDMPPYQLNEEQIMQLPHLYGDDVPLTDSAKGLIQFFQFLGKDKDYKQICDDQPPLIGTINKDASDPQKHHAQDFDPWVAQFKYQHNYGYLNVLGLGQEETELVEWILGPGAKK